MDSNDKDNLESPVIKTNLNLNKITYDDDNFAIPDTRLRIGEFYN